MQPRKKRRHIKSSSKLLFHFVGHFLLRVYHHVGGKIWDQVIAAPEKLGIVSQLILDCHQVCKPHFKIVPNGWFILESPIEMDDFGYPHFRKSTFSKSGCSEALNEATNPWLEFNGSLAQISRGTDTQDMTPMDSNEKGSVLGKSQWIEHFRLKYVEILLFYVILSIKR